MSAYHANRDYTIVHRAGTRALRAALACLITEDSRYRDDALTQMDALFDDPALQDVTMVAEPWDVGMGGWQVGNFPRGYSEWNDGYRDRMRNFWLRDIAAARARRVRESRRPRAASPRARRRPSCA